MSVAACLPVPALQLIVFSDWARAILGHTGPTGVNGPKGRHSSNTQIERQAEGICCSLWVL